MTAANIKNYFVSPDTTVKTVIGVIDNNNDGIALVVDSDGKLVGTVTDGDVRRLMLAKGSIEKPCKNIMSKKPITASLDASDDFLRKLISKHRLNCIPLIDSDGIPQDLIRIGELINGSSRSDFAVIMAGGEGKRLLPLTKNTPKPMIVVGDHPHLENIIENLKKCGITKIFISVNYKAQVIEEYFGNGEKFGVEIVYLKESKKLGTAGALSLLPDLPLSSLLIVNGDVVSEIDFARLLDFHKQHECTMTVAGREYHINVPYGELVLAHQYLVGIEEKPKKSFLCNAGIYVVKTHVLRFVPSDEVYDMTDLVKDIIREGLPIVAFPLRESWIDIGKEEDLNRAREEWNSKNNVSK